MKRWICALCALALTALSLTAFAVEGDAMLCTEENTYIQRMFAADDLLYMDSHDALLVYAPGDDEPSRFEWQCDYSDFSPEDASLSGGNYELLEGDGGLWRIDHLMRYYEEGSRLEKTLLSRVALEDGAATLCDTREIPWTDALIDRYDNNEYPMSLESCCIRNGRLYAGSYTWTMTVLDLETGEAEQTYGENVELFMPYAGDTLLLAGRDYGAEGVALHVFDPADSSIEPLVTVQLSDARGLAADPASGRVYALSGGDVCEVDLATGQLGEPLADVPMMSNGGCGWMLAGRYYAVKCDGGVVVRDLMAEDRPTRRLKIVDSSWTDGLDDAYFAFSSVHGDVAVSVTRDYQGNLIEDMMNRSDEVDVFILYTSLPEYDALLERGFLAELDSPALEEKLANVYPGVKERLTRNGELVAMPVNCYYWPMSIHRTAAERLGLNAEDVPENWSDFLDFLIDTLPGMMAQSEDVRLTWDGMTAGSVRMQLLMMILSDYQSYLSVETNVSGYDTPMLCELLQKLNRVDFEAMGVPADPEEDAASSTVVYTSGNDEMLLGMGMGASFGNFTEDARPLVMSMDADSPSVMGLEMYVAVINPFSDEVELAREFLETLSEKLPQTVMYNLDPNLNDPVRDPNSDEYLKNIDEYLAEVQKRLDEAADADRQALEEELKDAEEMAADAERYSWKISQAQIDWFRAHDDCVIAQPVNWMYRDSSGEAYELMQQFIDRQIDAKQFLKAIDKKYRMMEMEGY